MKLKEVDMTLLFDFYGELLTEKQRQLFDLYYNQDFSLGEIAENEGISRQGVHDTIARAEQVLTRMEEKTGFVARIRRMESVMDAIAAAAAELCESTDPLAQGKAREILSMMEACKE